MRKHRFPGLPFTLVVFIALLKGYYAIPFIPENTTTLPVLLEVVSNDSQIIALVALLGFLSAGMKRSLLQRTFAVTLSAITVWYLFDTAILVGLNARLGVNEFFNYLPELYHTDEGIFFGVGAIALLIFLSVTRIFQFPVKRHKTGIALAIMPLLIAPAAKGELLSYFATPVRFEIAQIIGREVPPLSTEELADYRADELYSAPISFGASSPSVILVIVESLSAADSYKTSGLGNLLPHFDEMASDGMLFQNFFANYFNTEGGLISLLSGLPPIQFPGSNWNLYESYTGIPSVFSHLEAPYKKLFFASSSISFRGEHDFIRSLGFQDIQTLDTQAIFQRAPRFAFRSPSDKVLYNYTLQRVEELLTVAQPFFLAVETTSSHRPYVDPLGRAPTERNIWSFVDQQLHHFYTELKASGFFENGILIVTGDHRKMVAPEPAEQRLYGGSARYRLALLVVGKGIPQGVVDARYFQQSDLLRQLAKLSDLNKPLSKLIYLVENYRQPIFGHRESQTGIIASTLENAFSPFQLHSFGRTLSWEKPPPTGFRDYIESEYLQLIAYLQSESSKLLTDKNTKLQN